MSVRRLVKSQCPLIRCCWLSVAFVNECMKGNYEEVARLSSYLNNYVKPRFKMSKIKRVFQGPYAVHWCKKCDRQTKDRKVDPVCRQQTHTGCACKWMNQYKRLLIFWTESFPEFSLRFSNYGSKHPLQYK